MGRPVMRMHHLFPVKHNEYYDALFAMVNGVGVSRGDFLRMPITEIQECIQRLNKKIKSQKKPVANSF